MKLLIGLLFASIFSTNALAVECSGTEPFWGAKISTDKIVLEYPGEPAALVLPVTSVSGAWGFSADFLKVYSCVWAFFV
jgi:hypothetical protein